MRFFRDEEHEKAVWIDRGLDCKVDHFDPCEVCNAILAVQSLEDRIWQDLSLCAPCVTRLEIESAIAEVRDERPYNLDREVETIVAKNSFPGDMNHCEADDYYSLE